MNIVKAIDQRKNWWKIFVIIFAVSVSVVGYVGFKTYQYAPPITDFVAEDGKLVFTAPDITAGQQVFFSHGLMEYGSFLGDGGMRGPDFTAEALKFMANYINAF
jgi:nitric oxide reductase subunit B